MATSQQFLVCDSSTLANFKQWAQAISGFFTTAGWTQSTDTGQVNWGTIASVPGSGAFVYEIWKPGDALTAFYVKIEYGNVGGTNCPSIRLSLGMATNGAGTLTGFTFGPVNTNGSTFTPPSTTSQFECNFSGSNNRIAVMMWRNGTNNCQQFFAIERSLDSSGSSTGTYATLWTGGQCSGNNNFSQRSLVFAIGPAPGLLSNNSGFNAGGLAVRVVNVNGSTAFNNGIPFDTATPMVGFFDYPSTSVGAGWGPDFVEGVTFTVTLYGSVRTFMPSKNGPFTYAQPVLGNSPSGGFCLGMRYD